MTTLTEIHPDENIVLTAFADSYYVDLIADADGNIHRRWSEENPTKWTDHQECITHNVGDVERSMEIAKEAALDHGLSPCGRCRKYVTVGELVAATGSYVANICKECKGSCVKCGENSWESLGRKRKHSATSPPRWKCNECGHIKKGITTG